MEFLKAILGEELYKQFEAAIISHNGNEANKDSQVKLANLASGEYVGKGKYDALNDLLKGKETELATANELIAGLKKSEKGNEELQTKIGTYEQQITTLQQQLEQTQLDSEIKIELLAAKALDVDYLTYKLKEKGELSRDEHGKIKGWDDKLAALKTQFPTQFESSNSRHYEERKLPGNEPGDNVITKEEFNKMGYNSRVEFKRNNPEQYAQLTK